MRHRGYSRMFVYENTLSTSHGNPVQKPYHQSICGKNTGAAVYFAPFVCLCSRSPRTGDHTVVQRNICIPRKQMGAYIPWAAFCEFPRTAFPHPSL